MKQKHEALNNSNMKTIGLLIFVLVVLASFLICVSPMLYNRWSLYWFAKPFFDYSLPPETQEINRQTEVGLIWGNGNHCDFLAERYLVTTLSENEIKDYYRNVEFVPVQTDSVTPVVTGTENIPLRIDFQAGTPNRVTLSLIDYPYYTPLRMWDISCH